VSARASKDGDVMGAGPAAGFAFGMMIPFAASAPRAGPVSPSRAKGSG
jgi:hypothetical protein